MHDALINQQLQHFSYAKALSRRQRSQAMKNALEATISEDHQAALAASMRAVFEKASKPTQTPPSPLTSDPQEDSYSLPYHLRRERTYNIGEHQVTDEEYFKLLLDHSNTDLASRLGVTQQAVCDRRRHTLQRESERTGVSYDELQMTLTEARKASGARVSQKGVPKGPRRSKKSNSEVDGKQTAAVDSDEKVVDAAIAQKSTSKPQVVKLVDYPDSDDEMDEAEETGSDSSGRDTAPSTPVEEARAALQAKAIRQRMEVSALLNSDDDDDKMDLS